LREVIPGALPVEGHEVEEEEDPDGGRDDEQRQDEEADCRRLWRRLVFLGCPGGIGRLARTRLVDHRTGRYLLACVIGLGTKIASFSQTVSHSRHETQGPASTSAVLWKVSWRGSSIRGMQS